MLYGTLLMKTLAMQASSVKLLKDICYINSQPVPKAILNLQGKCNITENVYLPRMPYGALRCSKVS